MRTPVFQVNVFVDGPFSGNPAAVCPTDYWLPDEVMQGIAADNNLSETAFLVARPDGDYDLRWFTPTVEVDLCGHATVAAGYVVLNNLSGGHDSVVFHTRSGELTVGRQDDIYVLDIPARVPEPSTDRAENSTVTDVLGAEPIEILDAGLPVAVFDSQIAVAELSPDFSGIVAKGLYWISVTAPADDSETDFVSRYFAPGSGIDEDPVTGSAHGWLVPYWSARLGKPSLTARQISRRGGLLSCTYQGDRVLVGGQVSESMRGEIKLD